MIINGNKIGRQQSISNDDDPVIQDVQFTKRNSITQQKNEKDIFFTTEVDHNYKIKNKSINQRAITIENSLSVSNYGE